VLGSERSLAPLAVQFMKSKTTEAGKTLSAENAARSLLNEKATAKSSASEAGDGDEPELDQLDEEPKSIILSMLSQVKLGMDLHKIHFPTFVLEPRSMLERITDFVSHPHLILR
jgi:hypothetical protein